MKYLGITRSRRFSSLHASQLPQIRSLAFLLPTTLAVLAVQQYTHLTPKLDVPAVQQQISMALAEQKSAALEDAYRMFGRLPFEPDPIAGSQDPASTLNVATIADSDTPLAGPPSDHSQIDVTVAPKDNLSLIFSRLKLPSADLHEIVGLGKATAPLKELRPGQVLRFRLQGTSLEEMVLELDQLNSLSVQRSDAGFVARVESIEPDIKVTAATTTITQSLFVDGQKVGLSDAVIMKLIDIFGWDIDFALDLQPNDRFSVIYEEVYKGEQLVKQDRILAAEFVNQGKRSRAVLYTGKDGRSSYYSDKGEAMHKTFLRTPVKFTRISSGFTLARRHPILNTIRAHRGVDYAAPMGTPVRATADGKIQTVGSGAGYGNLVEIRHGDSYSTLYGHLARFARGIKRGSSVDQGEIIGYVGQTGLATGPHLHYEFRINGIHRDPLKVVLPRLPIEKRYLTDFRERAAPLLNQLDVLVAKHDNTPTTYIAQLDSNRYLQAADSNSPN
jgi:murein DD-endopeptidase MepM/ murein hydrolase activator NlpD